MKRIIVFALVGIFSLSACQSERPAAPASSAVPPNTASPTVQSGTDSSHGSVPLIVHYYQDYDSYEALTQAMRTPVAEDYILEVEAAEEEKWGKGGYRGFVNRINELGCFYVPTWGDTNPAPLCIRSDGNSPIDILHSSLYNLTWLWFYLEVDGALIMVSTAYLDEALAAEANAEGFPTFIGDFCETVPRPDSFSSSYSDVYDTQVTIGTRTVPARVMIESETPRKYVYFVYDTMLVELWIDTDTLDLSLFEPLGFTPVSLSGS